MANISSINGIPISSALDNAAKANTYTAIETASYAMSGQVRIVVDLLYLKKDDFVFVTDDTLDCVIHKWNYDTATDTGAVGSWSKNATVPEDGYYTIWLRYSNDAGISDAEAVLSCVRIASNEIPQYGLSATGEGISIPFSNNIINVSTLTIQHRADLAGTTIFEAEDDLVVEIDGTDYNFSVTTFDSGSLESATVVRSSGLSAHVKTIAKGSYVAINVSRPGKNLICVQEVLKAIKISKRAISQLGIESMTKSVDIKWTLGRPSADGHIDYSATNYACSEIIGNPVSCTIDGVLGSIDGLFFFYKEGEYLGKISQTGEAIDKVASSWGRFIGDVNLLAYMKRCGANSVRFFIRFVDGRLTTENVQSEAEAVCSVNAIRIADSGESVGGYVITPQYTKQDIITTYMGNLTKHQSFCKYGNMYYSTDGASVAKQNLDFTPVSEVAMSVGHGNAFQLGSNGLAYVSGWDDNSVYVIDLNEMSLAGTIALPTTGYTTVAVDDLNSIAYIFQRDTRPNTQENYNFIVYDYDSESVVSTRKIRSFGAMQACDYLDGKILVAYGMGTSELPSGIFVCNTSGDVLADYVVDAVSSVEPEGIMFDRDNGGRILLSDISKRLYKIELA